MQHSSLVALVVSFAACSSSPPAPPPPSLVQGPYSGATHTFYVDRLSLPQRAQFLGDYGDGLPHDQLGVIDTLLQSFALQSTSVGDELQSGALSLRLELVSDDPRLRDDATVGVRFIGDAQHPGDQLGATLQDGALHTNRIADLNAPTVTTLTLPLFADSDPVSWSLEAVEIDLTSDGNGGFDGQLHGAAAMALADDDVIGQAYPSFTQMIDAQPQAHADAIHTFDADRDGTISRAELAGNAWVRAAAQPDLVLHDADGRFAPRRSATVDGFDAVSLGIGFHVTPCSDAACSIAVAPPRCDDRVKNGDETDVDCGGSCGPCAAGLVCTQATDCSSGACASGLCAAPTCSDGIRDGFEIDVDCGPGCGGCANGKRCYDDGDCLSGTCTDGTCSAQVQLDSTTTSRN